MSVIAPRDKTTICVIGGTGFIGRYLINELSKQNNFIIKVLTRHQDKAATFPYNVQIVVGDLMVSQSMTSFIIPDSIVVNLAYLNTGTKKDNLKVAEKLASACNKVDVKRLIHVSTAVVVGRSQNNLVTEETTCLPGSLYEKTKLEIEKIFLKEIEAPCETVIVRPTAVFGPGGKNLLKLTGEVMSDSRLKKMLKTAMFADRRLNLVCIENVVAAILFLARFKGDLTGQCFLISDDDAEENNYRDVTRLLAQHFGLAPVDHINLPFQAVILSILLQLFRGTNTNPRRRYDAGKLDRLGCRKAISFGDGLRKFATWYLSKRYQDYPNTV